ncbi:hypothetical protein V6N13_081456 [Hibiscus sabdariffa]
MRVKERPIWTNIAYSVAFALQNPIEGVLNKELIRGCPWCGLGVESSFHLFDCRHLRSLWLISISVAIWNLCKAHNDHIFNNEIMAIFIALDIFREASWIGKAHLVLESDSRVALTRISDKSQKPWRW